MNTIFPYYSWLAFFLQSSVFTFVAAESAIPTLVAISHTCALLKLVQSNITLSLTTGVTDLYCWATACVNT